MIREVLEFFFDISMLSENKCSLCKKIFVPSIQGYVCEGCLNGIKRAEIDIRPLKYVKHYRIFGRYKEGWGEIIRLLKFKRVKPFARFIAEKIRYDLIDYMEFLKPDMVTFVPIHLIRFWLRGIDHNKEILLRAGIDFRDILVRTRWQKPLVFYDIEKRMDVIKGSFDLKRGIYIEGMRILIFDDVITTGATASTVSEMLISKGAKEVYWYFIAG